MSPEFIKMHLNITAAEESPKSFIVHTSNQCFGQDHMTENTEKQLFRDDKSPRLYYANPRVRDFVHLTWLDGQGIIKV